MIGRITAVRAAKSARSSIEFELAPLPSAQNPFPVPVRCFAPAVRPDGHAVDISERHLAAAREQFVGCLAEFEIDGDGAIRSSVLWNRSSASP